VRGDGNNQASAALRPSDSSSDIVLAPMSAHQERPEERPALPDPCQPSRWVPASWPGCTRLHVAGPDALGRLSS